jgi:hypothetical protein
MFSVRAGEVFQNCERASLGFGLSSPLGILAWRANSRQEHNVLILVIQYTVVYYWRYQI